MRAVTVADATSPIAVFDSGVGGLAVLHECLVSLPHEDFVYLADTARFPYGDRDPAELREFAAEIGELLVAEGAKLLVVACNSVTSAALPELREALAGRAEVVGVVEPESRRAARVSANGRIGLLATPATVGLGAYERMLERVAPGALLTSVPCPELAPYIQRGEEVDAQLVELVDGYCAPLHKAGVDTVILGCTHYPLVRPILQRALGRGVNIVTSGQAIADTVEEALQASGLARPPSGARGDYRFLCSGDPAEFRRLGRRFLQLPIEDVRQVQVAPGRPLRRAA